MKNNQMLSNVILPKKEWGEIDLTDIQDSTVLSIPLEHIFEASFAKHLRDLSKASGVSVDYLLLSLLVITSVIIGNKRSIHVRNGWTDEPAHLWGALVGNPSTRKTVSIRIMQKAIKNLTMARTSEYKQQKKEYDKVLKEYNSGRLHEEPKKPILRQLIINDSTVEAICKVINPEKPECVCIFRDELTGLIGMLSKYNNGDRSFFLEGYNSNPYTINRVKLDNPICIPKLSLSILGTIQPQKLNNILNEADDGFISRFLFAFPEAEFSEEPQISIDETRIKFIFEKIDQLPLTEKCISLSAEAKELFNQWHRENEIETKRYVEGILQSSYGKMGGQAVRLACALEHIFWVLSDKEEAPQTISKDTILKAIVLIEDYFKPMIKKVLVERSHCSYANSLSVFIRYLIDNKLLKFNVRELKRKNEFLIYKTDEEKVLSNLSERNIIQLASTGKSGRPSKDYIVNPKLMEIKL